MIRRRQKLPLQTKRLPAVPTVVKVVGIGISTEGKVEDDSGYGAQSDALLLLSLLVIIILSQGFNYSVIVNTIFIILLDFSICTIFIVSLTCRKDVRTMQCAISTTCLLTTQQQQHYDSSLATPTFFFCSDLLPLSIQTISVTHLIIFYFSANYALHVIVKFHYATALAVTHEQ